MYSTTTFWHLPPGVLYRSFSIHIYEMQELFHSHLSNAIVISLGFSLVLPAISQMSGSVLNVPHSKNGNMCTASRNCVPENTGGLGNFPRLLPTCAVKDGLLPYVFDYTHATGLPGFRFVAKTKCMGLAYGMKITYVFLRTVESIATAFCHVPVEANQCNCLHRVWKQNLNLEHTPDLKGGWSRCLLSAHNIFNYKATTWCFKLIPMRTYIYFLTCCYSCVS